MLRKIDLTVLAALLCGSLYATPAGYGVDLSLGVADPTVMAQYSRYYGSWRVSGRVMGMYEFMVPLSDDEKVPAEHLLEYGLLGGMQWEKSGYFISAAAGLSLVQGTIRGDFLRPSREWFDISYYKERNILTVGLPVEVQCYGMPFTRFGAGVTFFGNLNTERSYLGALLLLTYRK